MNNKKEPSAAESSFVIPLKKISDDALLGLIEEFILREGTDYGNYEYTLEQKHEQIKKQLLSERIFIVFDPAEQSASIVRKENLPHNNMNTIIGDGD